ncbi:MAG: hypothetical protein H6738_09055 [Alphaproteobacteria bacterium]|nr:hypothetical protein [Alphaproteobacteria bacterium]MCB9696910.1 hypothetical protein [Alphaproteobacteria bacterium]
MFGVRVADTGPPVAWACAVGNIELGWPGLARALQSTAEARRALTRTLAERPEAAIFWETTPIDPSAPDRPMRFVALDAPALARVAPQPEPFRAVLSRADRVAAFDSLGGDARLVAPCPEGPDAHYTHLTAFLRNAPETQIHALWARVGAEIEAWIAAGRGPLWVSTSGLGVHWLHVRLDSVPKYYQHGAFRRLSGRSP